MSDELEPITDFVPEWERNRKVGRRCVCRGDVVVTDYPTPEAILTAVVLHQESPVHQEWTDRGGMEAEVYGRSPDVVIRRMGDRTLKRIA